ncbi:MAG: sigma-70 family RNA polymerase sigma factor [Pseudomonadota bacterium]
MREEGALLARYAAGVLRNHYAGEVDVAMLQDIVGEAVLAAAEIIRASDGRAPQSQAGLALWLRKIVAFKALEALRRSHRVGAREVDLDALLESLASDDWTELLAADELARAVESASNGLTAKEQDVIRKSVVDGMTSAQLGQALGVSSEAARQAKSRALAKLRRRLERLGG